MQISTFSSREFNQHVAAAKKAASADNLVYPSRVRKTALFRARMDSTKNKTAI